MSILVHIVSHPYTPSNRTSQPDAFGFRALKPAIAVYPQFLKMLVTRLSSADHALCANAMLLINSLMRDAITKGSEDEWPKFVQHLQEMGVFDSVYMLMQGTAIQDLSHPLLEFQALTKVMLRRWRDMAVDMDNSEHRNNLKTLHLASIPNLVSAAEKLEHANARKQKHEEKWRRLGFKSERPADDFDEMGYLGMIDMVRFAKGDEDRFQKLLLEQLPKLAERRFPFANSSLAATSVLYEHFGVEQADIDDARNYFAFETRTKLDKIFHPMILRWSMLHVAVAKAFLRIWQAIGATIQDFTKTVELVRILVEAVVGGASRTKDVDEILTEINEFSVVRLRTMQMELLAVTYEGAYGQHLLRIRDELHDEALQFVKEQRIRCLLAGSWFYNYDDPKLGAAPTTAGNISRSRPISYRYVKLSHNRRHLHYADFQARDVQDPSLGDMPDKVDLTGVLAVTSQVIPSSDASSSTSTIRAQNPTSMTKITITGRNPLVPRPPPDNPRGLSGNMASSRAAHAAMKEVELLNLHVENRTLASEWLDGLLMVLNQQPITAETKKMINTIQDYGLKIRLLNANFQTMQLADDAPEVPDREGVGDEFYYDDFHT